MAQYAMKGDLIETNNGVSMSINNFMWILEELSYPYTHKGCHLIWNM